MTSLKPTPSLLPMTSLKPTPKIPTSPTPLPMTVRAKGLTMGPTIVKAAATVKAKATMAKAAATVKVKATTMKMVKTMARVIAQPTPPQPTPLQPMIIPQPTKNNQR